MRRAEQTIYRILEECAAPGRALYEARILPHGRQTDFPVWVEQVARYAVEVKGGRYIVNPETGECFLLTGGWRYRKDSPVAQAWDTAKSLPEAIKERLHRGVYIIAVIAFTDMEPDQVIMDVAARNHVDVLFGTDRWMERLVELAGPHQILLPPTADQIDQEVALVMPRAGAPGDRRSPAPGSHSAGGPAAPARRGRGS